MSPHSLIDDNGHYLPAPYILSMSCVSGDEVQVAIHRREDIFRWLKTLDHEGANWSVVEHKWQMSPGDHLLGDGVWAPSQPYIYQTDDLTSEIEAELQSK